MALSQKVLEDFEFSKKNIPNLYPKLLHPVHGNDKMLIIKKLIFTYLIYLQVQEVISYIINFSIPCNGCNSLG